jgi:hypothetical protein
VNKKKLSKIEKQLREIRKSPRGIRSDDLVRIAGQLGRTRSKRGSEPTYVRESDPRLRPLSIPSHPGDLKVKTCVTIVDMLLDDVDEWRLSSTDESDDEDGNNENDS